MEFDLREISDLVIRWIHLIAGIMWIGNSMLFNWLDRNLIKKTNSAQNMVGEIYLLHSGGYYQVEKKLLTKSDIPDVLHWFKWQSYTTWISGIGLLFIVYYMGGEAFLVNPEVFKMSYEEAILASIMFVFGGWAIYEILWRVIGEKYLIATGISLCLAFLAIFTSTHLFEARAAYVHVGALFGTIMSGNVFMHIIPSQKRMLDAAIAGDIPDPSFGIHAKTRSVHNNYITFPVLFIMLSNHFPSTWGNNLNWLVLMIVVVGGSTARHFLNIRFHFKKWLICFFSTVIITISLLFYMIQPDAFDNTPKISKAVTTNAVKKDSNEKKVSFAIVNTIIHERCVTCHSEKPIDEVFTSPPVGVKFDNPKDIERYTKRIKNRVIDTNTMPFNNKTGMTDIERQLLSQWISEGASIK